MISGQIRKSYIGKKPFSDIMMVEEIAQKENFKILEFTKSVDEETIGEGKIPKTIKAAYVEKDGTVYLLKENGTMEYLGFDVDELKSEMIGLKGRNRKEKLQKYFDDMNKVMSEISRVLKVGKYAIIIIGSNDIQTGGIRLENKIKEFGNSYGLNLVKEIRKPIKGIRNTMHEEFILIFRKGA